MAKEKSVFVCSACGGESVRWQGQCQHCKEWNTLSEEVVQGKTKENQRFKSWTGSAGSNITKLSSITASDKTMVRLLTGQSEFDRVLGGGVVKGSVILLGGDPGIGKSTLLLQTVAAMGPENTTLYITGEESLSQIKSRADRLQLDPDAIHACTEIILEKILATLEREKPNFVVIDSIQTIYSEEITSAPGSVSQVKECASQLTRMAKQNDITIVLVGHITKEGTIAGPRVLEHLVDTVLYFEGDPQSPYRLIRAFKNRFGAINEIGTFEMTQEGLVSIDNPSAIFLTLDRQASPGSCVFIMQEGQRSLLIDIQALADDSPLGNPKRLAVGVDYNRVSMLLAVLHKHGGLTCGNQDVFVNAVGGVKANEPACDLPMCLAVISSLRNKAIPIDVACFGEVGLTGELRPVQRSEDRIKEAIKLGFTRIMVPKRNMPKTTYPNVDIRGIQHLSEAFYVIKDWES